MGRKLLRLNGNAVVYIDWANVYGWRSSIRKTAKPSKLIRYLKTYPEIKTIRFYYGTDKHPKSIEFLHSIKNLGYKVITKPVKYLTLGYQGRKKITQRKCDFDLEISVDTMKSLQNSFYQTYIFFSGDGDFKYLYQELLTRHKQVIVVYANGHLGREVASLGKQIFLVNVKSFPKNIRTLAN